MKPLRSPIALLLLMAAIAFNGCGQDRQMVYTAPRSKPIQVENSNGVKIQVPANKPLPASNGVDVPMVEQN